MTQRTWKERDDWVEGNRRTVEPGGLGRMRRNCERRKMIGEEREWEVKVGDR